MPGTPSSVGRKLNERTNASSLLLLLLLLTRVLCQQCFAMDRLGVNKEEMTHPHRHVIVHRSKQPPPTVWRCTFVDFEKCSSTTKPKNVTQLCQVRADTWMMIRVARRS